MLTSVTTECHSQICTKSHKTFNMSSCPRVITVFSTRVKEGISIAQLWVICSYLEKDFVIQRKETHNRYSLSWFLHNNILLHKPTFDDLWNGRADGQESHWASIRGNTLGLTSSENSPYERDSDLSVVVRDGLSPLTADSTGCSWVWWQHSLAVAPSWGILWASLHLIKLHNH